MMDQAKEEHLKFCMDTVSVLQREKYVNGQEEHGGNMWAKTGMLNAALEEVVDLANYIPTIQLQISKASALLEKGESESCLQILRGLLSKEIN